MNPSPITCIPSSSEPRYFLASSIIRFDRLLVESSSRTSASTVSDSRQQRLCIQITAIRETTFMSGPGCLSLKVRYNLGFLYITSYYVRSLYHMMTTRSIRKQPEAYDPVGITGYQKITSWDISPCTAALPGMEAALAAYTAVGRVSQWLSLAKHGSPRRAASHHFVSAPSWRFSRSPFPGF